MEKIAKAKRNSTTALQSPFMAMHPLSVNPGGFTLCKGRKGAGFPPLIVNIVTRSVNFCNYKFVKGVKMLPEEWTGRLIGEMHNREITYDELGAELGVTNAYISMVLNGKRNPKNAQERFTSAMETISRRKRNGGEGRA